MTPDGLRPYVYMLCGCFWFSLMALLAHAAGELCDWQVVALARSGLVTVFSLAAALAAGARLAFVRPRVLWVRSVAGSLSMVTTFYALARLPTSDVLTLTNTFPAWVAVLSWPVAGERPSAGVWAAVACAVAGVALTQQPDLFAPNAPAAGPGGFLGLPLAAWSALAAALFAAFAMLGLNRLGGVSSLAVVVHFSAVATVFCGAAYLLFDRGTGMAALADPTAAGLLVGVALAATVGQVLLTLAFRAGSPTRVSVIGLTQVVMVMAVEAAVGWKTLTPVGLAGTALVLGPTAWLMLRAGRPRPPAVDAGELVAK